jgi:hypothetical protein
MPITGGASCSAGGGEQCKAPAEKSSKICHAHAGQLAMAVRRERERHAVLAEAVAQMRRRGRPDCEMADLFMDFKGINVTLAVIAKAVIDGRVDCKTAGKADSALADRVKATTALPQRTQRNTENINSFNHKGHPFDSPFAGSGSLRAGYETRRVAADFRRGTQIGQRKSFNHKGHPFDSPIASSVSLRAGCETRSGTGSDDGKELGHE